MCLYVCSRLKAFEFRVKPIDQVFLRDYRVFPVSPSPNSLLSLDKPFEPEVLQTWRRDKMWKENQPELLSHEESLLCQRQRTSRAISNSDDGHHPPNEHHAWARLGLGGLVSNILFHYIILPSSLLAGRGFERTPRLSNT